MAPSVKQLSAERAIVKSSAVSYFLPYFLFRIVLLLLLILIGLGFVVHCNIDLLRFKWLDSIILYVFTIRLVWKKHTKLYRQSR